jgi:threonine synthase
LRYVSTRGRAPTLGFDDVLLAGLATDGGLYVPEQWPTLSAADLRALNGRDYASVAARVMAPFVAGSVIEKDLAQLTAQAYGRFTHAAVAPMKQLAANEWLMELFHGPTFAFKDYALQMVGLMFERVLKARGSRITIVGATSGDTGSAAIEACKGKANIDIFILHPAGRTSEVQRRQMTTVAAANVHNIALEGTFDDCQDIVKALFADTALRTQLNLSAVNSINWARIMAQIVYYVWAAVHLGAPERKIAFAVPTGNFGNVFAGYCALQMGLPIAQFIVGSNRNDILTRYLETGSMKVEGVEPSLSPSMDIQVSSNFERLLFEATGRDGAAVTRLMDQFKQSAAYTVAPEAHRKITALFSGARLDDEGTKRVMREVHDATGEVVDPHSAVGIHAGRKAARDAAIPRVALATAHPAKFPDAVRAALGTAPVAPKALADVFNHSERYERIANDLGAVKRFIQTHVQT